MVRAAALIGLVVALTGCDRAVPTKEIADLQSDVASLKIEVSALQAKGAPTPVIAPKAELEVADGAQHFSRPLRTMRECQTARDEALAENQQRKTAMEAEDARARGAGFIQQLTFVQISAYCIQLAQ